MDMVSDLIFILPLYKGETSFFSFNMLHQKYFLRSKYREWKMIMRIIVHQLLLWIEQQLKRFPWHDKNHKKRKIIKLGKKLWPSIQQCFILPSPCTSAQLNNITLANKTLPQQKILLSITLIIIWASLSSTTPTLIHYEKKMHMII